MKDKQPTNTSAFTISNLIASQNSNEHLRDNFLVSQSSKQSENEGKPAEVIEKIIEGRIVSFYKDSVLSEQIFCNPEIYEGKVSTMIEEMSGKLGEKIYIKQF